MFGGCFIGILARLVQQPSSHPQMLTTGALDYLLHLLTASFSAGIVCDDAAWSAQVSVIPVCRSGCGMQVACTQLLKHVYDVTATASTSRYHDNTFTDLQKHDQVCCC